MTESPPKRTPKEDLLRKIKRIDARIAALRTILEGMEKTRKELVARAISGNFSEVQGERGGRGEEVGHTTRIIKFLLVEKERRAKRRGSCLK
jgi:hypothetical protein